MRACRVLCLSLHFISFSRICASTLSRSFCFGASWVEPPWPLARVWVKRPESCDADKETFFDWLNKSSAKEICKVPAIMGLLFVCARTPCLLLHTSLECSLSKAGCACHDDCDLGLGSSACAFPSGSLLFFCNGRIGSPQHYCRRCNGFKSGKELQLSLAGLIMLFWCVMHCASVAAGEGLGGAT